MRDEYEYELMVDLEDFEVERDEYVPPPDVDEDTFSIALDG